MLARLNIRGIPAFLALPAIFAGIAVLLRICYSLPLYDSLVWYLGAFFYFYVPGNLLLRYLNDDRGEHFGGVFHSTALGTALLPLLYGIFRRLDAPWLLHIPVIIMLLLWMRVRGRDVRSGKDPVQTSLGELISFVLLAAGIITLLHMTYFTDIVLMKDGLKMRNIYLTETDFHLGLVNMLRDTFPPLFPYASGKTLSYYHVNMHLEIEMFHRFLSIDTVKLVFFYFPLLYFSLLVSMPYLFVRACSGPSSLGVLAGILMFGADLSFVPGLLGIVPPDYPWAHLLPYPWTLFFRTTLWSVFCLNGFLPAMFTMTLSLVHLKRYFDRGETMQAVVFGVLGVAAFGFKSTMGPHIILSSIAAGVGWAVYAKGDVRGKTVCLVSLTAILVMAVDVVFLRGGTGNTVVHLDLFNNFRHSMFNLHMNNLPLVFYPAMFVLYALVSFGVRTPGFLLIREMAAKKIPDPVAVFLVVFSLLGFLVSELLYLGNEFRVENNAMWFAVQSLCGAWLLLSYFLVQYLPGKNRWGAVAIICVLAFPSTLQFLLPRFDRSYYEVDTSALEVVRYLEKTPAESIVLHPPASNGPSLAAHLAGRPSVISLLHTHVPDMLGEDETKRRMSEVSQFFSPGDTVDRISIARKYHVAFVYAPVEYRAFLDNEPFLLAVLSNRRYIIYQVRER